MKSCLATLLVGAALSWPVFAAAPVKPNIVLFLADEFLFDLEADPGEKQNLLSSRPADVRRLKAQLAAWENEVKAAR